MAKQEKYYSYALIAIVAIVAIIAITVMFKTSPNWVSTTDEKLVAQENLAGAAVLKCSDSDGGKNYYVKGRIYGYLNGTVSYNYNDACVNMRLLKERYCNLNKPASLYYTCSRPMNCTANCSYCKNGACIR